MSGIKLDIVNQNMAKANLEKIGKKATDPAEEARLKEACAGFEAIFMNKIISSMRQSLPGDALFKDSNASKIYKSMHDQYLSEELSKNDSSFGLKEFLFHQLKDSI